MNTKLIISCIGGTGALGGIAGGCYYLLNNKEPKKEQAIREENKVSKTKPKLKESLKDEDFEALDLVGETDKDAWQKLITKYNAEPAIENKIKIEGVITKSSEDQNAANIKILQKACKTLLDKTDIAKGDKEMAKNWCNKNSSLIKDT